MELLVLSPLALGVPHLVADVRYLFGSTFRRAQPWTTLVVALAMAAVALFASPRLGLAAIAVTAFFPRPTGAPHAATMRTGQRNAIFVLLLAAAGALAWWDSAFFHFLIAHGHHAVALLLWGAAAAQARPEGRRSFGRRTIALVALAASGAALATAAWPLSLLSRTGSLDGAWSALGADAPFLFPSHGPAAALWMPSPVTQVRFVLLGAFFQAVHYAVWLSWLPLERRRVGGGRSVRTTLRALHTDVGPAVLLLACVAMAAVAWVALGNIGDGRQLYFRIAYFHAYFELALLARAWLQRRSVFRP
jgi:hypothetical protein